jgi:hypothetical protein
MEHDVKKAKSSINMPGFIRSYMLREENPPSPQLPFFPKILSPPEERVEPKYSKDGNEKAGHEDKGSVEYRFSFRVIVRCMGNPLHEVSVSLFVTFAAGLYQPSLGDERLWIIRRQNVVKPVAVRAACNQFWIAKVLHLSMITFVIGLRGNEKNLVSLHHLLVCMTFLADFGMELLPKFHGLGFVPFQQGNFMEAMAIAAGGRIRVPLEDGFAVDALGVTIIRMTGRAGLDHPDFIPSPGGQLVNLLMAVLALNVIKEMGACIMFRRFFFMTSMAGDWLGMNPRPSCRMGLDICDVIMTTVARIGAMNRLGKLPFAYVLVTSQTFGVVNTFIAVFSPPDDKFLPLFLRFRRFGHHGEFPTLIFSTGCRCP